jgi:hypothetical protein
LKAAHAVLGLALAALALVLWADPAEATTVCQGGSGPSVANTCQGYGHVSTTTGGVASARCFAVRTTNAAPTCTTSGLTPTNEAWEMDAGACITFYYFETTSGLTPPAAPNKLTLLVYTDTTANAIRTYQTLAAPPASGTSFSFCATSTGQSTGTQSAWRAGTYRLYVNAVKDNGAGGVGNYNIDTDGTASVGSLINYDRGALRGQMLVSSIARNAYPSGSTFAYGPAGSELVTVTSTFTQPNQDQNSETGRSAVLDKATLTVGQAAATVDMDGTSLQQSFTVDQTFPVASGPYVAALDLQGNAALTGLRWTTFASTGHGSNLVRVSDTFMHNDQDFNINPDIHFDQDGTGTPDNLAIVQLGTSSGPLVDVLNRGEQYYAEWYLLNARGQKLTRLMTFAVEDAMATTCTSIGSFSPTSGKYSTTQTVPTGGSCAVAATEAGVQRFLRVTNSDQSSLTVAVKSVSSLYFVDAHTQISPTLVQDDFPTENDAEDFTYAIKGNGIGGDASDRINGWCHVVGVRRDGTDIDTPGSAVSWNLKDPTTATRASGTSDTGSDGWTGRVLDFLSSTPLGTWNYTCTATFNGNTGTNEQSLTVSVEGGGGETVYTGVDPMTVNVAWKEGFLNQSQLVSITARFLDGTARLDAEGEMLVDVYLPTGSLDVTGASPVEVGGGIYTYTYAGGALPGDYLVVVRNTDPPTMGGAASNAFLVQNATGNLTTDLANLVISLQEHRDHSLELTTMNDFNGIGFDGLLYLLVFLGIGWLAFRRGLEIHPAWGGVLLLCALSIITIVLGTLWSPAAQVPPAWGLLGIALWVLMMYALSGFGLTTGKWAGGRDSKEEKGT